MRDTHIFTQPESPSSSEASAGGGDDHTNDASQSRNQSGPSHDNTLSDSIIEEDQDEDDESQNPHERPFSTATYERLLADMTDSSSDDESSVSSSESERSNLMSIRIRNIARNELFLSQLNEKYKTEEEKVNSTKGGVDQVMDHDNEVDEGFEDGVGRGMIFDNRYTCNNATTNSTTPPTLLGELRTLQEMYPHREHQIQVLVSLLDSNTGQFFYGGPAPIFVTGPSATAKTSVVTDVVDSLKRRKQSMVSTAYVNCAILEPSTIDRLVASSVSQLKRHSFTSKRKKRKKISGPRRVAISKPSKLEVREQSQRKSSICEKDASSNQQNEVPIGETPKLDIRKESLASRQLSGVFHPQRSETSLLLDASSVIASFGRALQPICGRDGEGSAILVLDQAERLLSLSMRKPARERTNFLNELLILPKAMDLNLTIIVISKNSLLDCSRLNSLVSVGKSVSTLSNGVQPHTIQFEAYRDAETFIRILRLPKLLRLIVGNDVDLLGPSESENIFQRKLISTFLSTIVQSIRSSTRDIREFVRVGRSMWPVYVQPLLPSSVGHTMSLAKNAVESKYPNGEISSSMLETELLAILDRKFLPQVGRLLDGLFSLWIDSPAISTVTAAADDVMPKNSSNMWDGKQPYLRSCLLLAAFVCQNNKANEDKRVFSAQRNSNKRARRQSHDNSVDDVAFISRVGERLQLAVTRPRVFPLERMLSIFVTIVTLNPPNSSFSSLLGGGDLLQLLGSSFLSDNLAQLRDLGYLHQTCKSGQPKSEQSLSASKHWCSLSRAEAISIADAVDIPLNSYLL